MTSNRIADYFIVAGLPDVHQPVDNFSSDSPQKSTKFEPITDLCIIIPSEGEECPPGYKVLLETPSGHMADLNHGSIRSPEIFICYRKGRDKPPLTDIGVLYDGNERVLPGCEIVQSTPYGRPANINNSQTQKIFLTYRRAQETASSDTLAVTDICVVISSKGEQPPHSYCKIDKNLNKGIFMGSNVYICYRKSMCKDYSVAYKPGVLTRYPQWNWPDFNLPEDSVAMFALPMGAVLESWVEKAVHPKPVFSSFVLTTVDYKKIYGAAVTFYEPFPHDKLNDKEKKALGLHLKKKRNVHVNRAICLLSKHPYFDGFKDFLNYLLRLTTSEKVSDVPIERLIGHLLFDVPFPNPERPRVMVQLSSTETVLFRLPDECPLPLSGASFNMLLKNLACENTVNLLTYVLLEQKIVIHSLRPAVLTRVIEAVGSMIFPFCWQCPYVPLCPLGLSEVLYAPCPFIVGVDSRYFDLFDPPPDVTCIDLDTGTITQPADKVNVSHKMLPKRPVKVLRATLERIYHEMREDHERSSRMLTNQRAENEAAIIAKLDSIDLSIREAFLRFMSCILKGYKNYLLPIIKAPSHESTNVKELFDMKGFLKSRDKAYHKLYEIMLRTQAFTRFIEERSFNIREDSSMDFFDTCIDKVDENLDTPRLLESDHQKSDHTSFVPPPLPEENPNHMEPANYRYRGFPSQLKYELFPQKEPPSATNFDKKGFMARRTKAEIKVALKVAKGYKDGIASPSLWAKCIVGNCFSLWFIHLPAFADVSQSPGCALRAAFAILEKIQENRLQKPDEVCYRTMMQLCGMYQLPVLAVKLLVEMRKIGISVNAITYGFYNKAVLESKWPAGSSNGIVLWRRLKNIILGASQFKQALKRNRRYSTDLDSVSHNSMDSSDIICDADSSTKDVHSTASDVGYSSMSAEDIRKEQIKSVTYAGSHHTKRDLIMSDEFRSKVGSIIKRSTKLNTQEYLNHSSTHFHSAAGLLITVSTPQRLKFISRKNDQEAYRKRHKSASDDCKKSLMIKTASVKSNPVNPTYQMSEKLLPDVKLDMSTNTPPVNDPTKVLSPFKSSKSYDNLKKSTVVSDDPLGLFSSNISEVKNSTPKSQDSIAAEDQSFKTMDIGTLFGRDSPKRALPSHMSENNLTSSSVKKYNLLQFSPEKENSPDFTHSNSIKKTYSLESQDYNKANSEDSKKSVYSMMQNNSTHQKLAKTDSADSKVSLDSVDVAGSNSVSESSQTRTPSYKSWVTSSLRRSVGAAVSSRFSLKVKNMVLGKPMQDSPALLSSHESLDSIGSSNSAPYFNATPQRGKTGDSVASSINRFKSVSNSMANKLYSNYNKIKTTVQEYQAPSTVSIKYERTTDNNNPNDDNVSVLSDQLSNTGIPAYITEENLGVPDDKVKAYHPSISYAGVSTVFFDQFVPKPSSQDSTDAMKQSSTSRIRLDVTLCTVTVCGGCSAILYDEDIMAGWTEQDSNLNTICRYCDQKIVPTLSVEIREVKKQKSDLANTSNLSILSHKNNSDVVDVRNVQYLSPLVLRKELENILESEGDGTLTKSSFVDDHGIVYWNLIWYFTRIHVPSHLPRLLLKSKKFQQYFADKNELNASLLRIKLHWDNSKLYEQNSLPMYRLWKDSNLKSNTVKALLTEDESKPRNLIQQILSCVQCNDLLTPLKLILSNRRQHARGSSHKTYSAYRDILFLSFVYFGQDNMDHDSFDREFKLAFRKLTSLDKQFLQPQDFPPTPTIIWCRKLFGALEIS